MPLRYKIQIQNIAAEESWRDFFTGQESVHFNSYSEGCRVAHQLAKIPEFTHGFNWRVVDTFS